MVKAPKKGAVIDSVRKDQDFLPRRAIIVLGSHRSGTSALTRILSFCGAALPGKLMASNSKNARGFFESEPIYQLHEQIFSDLGSSWKDISPLPQDWIKTAAASQYIGKMAELVTEEFGEAPLFVLKDPRICRIVPFWIEVLDAIQVEPVFVLPIRNPLEVAASLEKSDLVDQQKGLLIWLTNMLQAEHDSRGYSRSFVEYGSLLKDWRGVVTRIGADLSMSFPRLGRRAEAQADAFLAKELRHHVVSDEELSVREDVLDWVKTTFGWMSRAAAGKKIPTREIDRLYLAFSEAEKAFGPILAYTELALESSDETARNLRDEVFEISAQRDAVENQVVPLSDESGQLKKRLESRDDQVRELINCIKLMLVWIASNGSGNKTSSEELQVLMRAMDSADSDSIAETTLEGLLAYQGSMDSTTVNPEAVPPRMGFGKYAKSEGPSRPAAVKPTEAELRQEISELKAKRESFETTERGHESQVRLLRDQLEEKQAVVGQVVAELAQSEEGRNRERSDALVIRGKLEEAGSRIDENFSDLNRREEELARREVQISSLQSEKLELERVHEEFEATAEENETAIAGLRADREHAALIFKSEKENLALEVDLLRKEKCSLEAKIRDGNERASETSSALETRDSEIEDLTAQAAVLVQEGVKAQEELARQEVRISSLQSEKFELERVHEELEATAEENETAIAGLRADREHAALIFKSEKENLALEVDLLRKEKSSLETKIRDGIERASEISSALETRDSEIEDLTAQAAVLVQEGVKAQEELARKEVRISSLQSEKFELERVHEELEATAEENETAIAGLRADREHAALIFKSEKENLALEVDLLRKEKCSLETKIRDGNERASETSSALETRDSEIEDLTTQTAVLVLEGAHAREQLSHREAELHSMRRSLSWRFSLPVRMLGQFSRKTGLSVPFRRLSKILGLRR